MTDYTYALYSDEELIEDYREGNNPDAIADYLIRKYKGLVEAQATSMFILGGDRDDLIQEGRMGLLQAIRDYDPGRDASFRTFAQLCVSRQIYTAVQAAGRKKHIPLNTAVSLSTMVGGDNDAQEGDHTTLGATIPSRNGNPEDTYIEGESAMQLEEEIGKVLSPFEKQVLDLLLTGMNYVDIAHILGREPKSTDNAIQRIRTKLRKFEG